MAKFNDYWPTLVEWEGAAYENVPGDSGGPTKYGVTLEDWKHYGVDQNADGIFDYKDVQLITAAQAMDIAKKKYWDLFGADQWTNQSIAELVVDGSYNQGFGWMAPTVQKLLGLVPGPYGPKTIGAINGVASPSILFEMIKKARIDRYNKIIANNPSQEKFRKGWMNRVNSFNFK